VPVVVPPVAVGAGLLPELLPDAVPDEEAGADAEAEADADADTVSDAEPDAVGVVTIEVPDAVLEALEVLETESLELPLAVTPPCTSPGGQSLDPEEKLPFYTKVSHGSFYSWTFDVPGSRRRRCLTRRCTRGRSRIRRPGCLWPSGMRHRSCPSVRSRDHLNDIRETQMG
jgi:hypothetical protein